MSSKTLSRLVYKIRYTDCIALCVTNNQDDLEEPLKPIVFQFVNCVIIIPGATESFHRDLSLAAFFLRRMLYNDFIPQPALSSK